MNKKNLIIIGGGLTGLYLTTLLQERYNVTILEARERLGGRVLTQNGHDMGPSWIWQHQKNILWLTNELDLELFSQYTQGDALYDAPEGVQRFTNPPSAPSARIKGGVDKLIQALQKKIHVESICLNEQVEKLIYTAGYIQVMTKDKHYTVDLVISTLPPRLAVSCVVYEPSLDAQSIKELKSTPTWMGHTLKCIIEFESSFWRDEGLSGFCFSHLGPLGEIHDASTEHSPTLFGFLHSKASVEDLKVQVRKQMQRLFGDNAKQIKKIFFVDWRDECLSASNEDKKGITTHPDYGLDLSHFDGKLLFGGTETAYDNGGYLEGALISAKKISNKLLEFETL